MRNVRFARLGVAVLLAVGVPVMAVPTGAAATSEASAFTCPVSGQIAENLSGVAEISSGNAWAAGSCFDGDAPQTLVVHWNGTAWTQVASPNPGGPANRNQLLGVTALTSSNVWAAGFYTTPTSAKTLIEHWNGTSWQQVAGPNPGGSNGTELSGITATSSSNAWAVGNYCTSTPCGAGQTLILHWNGKAWTQVASPTPACPARLSLDAVAATSSSNAWAVGDCETNSASQTLILHWNGTAWKRVTSPSPACPSGVSLTGVAAVTSTSAWAVGGCYAKSELQTVILGWNGTAWKQVTSPNPGGSRGSALSSIAATSSTNAWAVGAYGLGFLGASQTLVVHWNGTAWRFVASP